MPAKEQKITVMAHSIIIFVIKDSDPKCSRSWRRPQGIGTNGGGDQRAPREQLHYGVRAMIVSVHFWLLKSS